MAMELLPMPKRLRHATPADIELLRFGGFIDDAGWLCVYATEEEAVAVAREILDEAREAFRPPQRPHQRH
jgi:hypothetical protein